MSDSDDDDSSVAAPVLLQTPRAVLGAGHDTNPAIPTDQEIRRRYKGFALLLCGETATSEASQTLLHGLPIAVERSRSFFKVVQSSNAATPLEGTLVFASSFDCV